MLHEQEQWLADNHADIAGKIEERHVSAERGDLLDPEQVRIQKPAVAQEEVGSFGD